MDLKTKITAKKKQLALLIDPENISLKDAIKITISAQQNNFSFIFMGGSLVSGSLDQYVSEIKKATNLPVILFPGGVYQITDKADGVLFLSLISGRNSDYLIGQHVLAAPFLKKSKISVIPTGYILIESGNITSVEYMSNTKPIPQSKPDIICATAMAGEMLGLKMIYLEAGSGAINHVNSDVIAKVKKCISIPLIVGGGIKTAEQLRSIFNAGADIAVIGTAIENNPGLIKQFGNILS